MARFWRQTLRRIPSWDACLALAVPAGCAGMLAEAYGRTAIGDAEPAEAELVRGGLANAGRAPTNRFHVGVQSIFLPNFSSS